jgi:hypothetical protein
MHNHLDQHELIMNILSQMAIKNNKSLEKIKRLLLIKQNNAIIRQFWQILDSTLPNHTFTSMGCCPGCGFFELCQ